MNYLNKLKIQMLKEGIGNKIRSELYGITHKPQTIGLSQQANDIIDDARKNPKIEGSGTIIDKPIDVLKNTANYIKGKVNDYRKIPERAKLLNAADKAFVLPTIFDPLHHNTNDEVNKQQIDHWRNLSRVYNGLYDIDSPKDYSQKYKSEIRSAADVFNKSNRYPLNKWLNAEYEPINPVDGSEIKNIINYVDRTNKYKDNPTK